MLCPLCAAIRSATAFLEARSLTATITQVVKLGTANFSTARDLDLFDTGTIEQESTLDADAMTGYTTYREVSLVTTLAQADHNTLENLNTFAVAFYDANVDLHVIAWCELGMICFGCLYGLHQFIHTCLPFIKTRATRL